MTILVPFGIVAGTLMILTMELVRLRRLKERYAVIWVGFATLILAGVVFPDAVVSVSEFLGFEVPANLVISSGIVVLAFVSIQLSVDLTRLNDKADRITNRLAIVELELREAIAETNRRTDSDT